MTPHAIGQRALLLARLGQHAAASHAYHLSRALFWRAGGDRDEMRIEMINVRTYGRQKRRTRHAVLA